jgi:hypothetical protein
MVGDVLVARAHSIHCRDILIAHLLALAFIATGEMMFYVSFLLGFESACQISLWQILFGYASALGTVVVTFVKIFIEFIVGPLLQVCSRQIMPRSAPV